MSKLTKKILIILASVLVIGLIAAIPGFAETQEELKKIFVTRQEFVNWRDGSGTHVETKTSGGTSSTTYVTNTGVSALIKGLEESMQSRVQDMVSVEMSRRNIKNDISSSTTS